jgi:GPI ethanolamine phosphate transferase 3 subunit O
MPSKGFHLLLWILFVNSTGIYLFLRGFLLTRLSLSETAACPDGSCILPPTHKRAVFLIIDSLRFDFIAPEALLDSPSSNYHNVLTLPRDLSQKYPQISLIFNSYVDPPTTTLQRIKGLTTGSLPTFVEVGSNFVGSSVEEDSIVRQLTRAGR